MTDERKTELRDNYLRVLERVENARIRRGGDSPVELLAASKTRPAEDIVYLASECGMKLCGENHAQEFRDKFAEVSAAGARMDFIGHLQSNKIKYVVGKAGLIHSLDSLKTAAEIDAQAKKLGVRQKVLVEVNIGGEATKTGISKFEVEDFIGGLDKFDSLDLCGMMSMAPKTDNNSENHKFFAESYRIFLDIFVKKTHNIKELVLSMGMSDSFEAAIEEGATLVRVGSSVFGAREYR